MNFMFKLVQHYFIFIFVLFISCSQNITHDELKNYQYIDGEPIEASLKKVNMLRENFATRVDVARDGVTPLYLPYNYDDSITFDIFKNDIGGVLCADTAHLFNRQLESLGYKSMVYSFGDETVWTHAVVLVNLQGDWFLQDPFFNVYSNIPISDLANEILMGNLDKIIAGNVSLKRDYHYPKKITNDQSESCINYGKRYVCNLSIMNHKIYLDNMNSEKRIKIEKFLDQHKLTLNLYSLFIFPLWMNFNNHYSNFNELSKNDLDSNNKSIVLREIFKLNYLDHNN